MKRNLKLILVPTIYIVSIAIFIGGIFFAERIFNNDYFIDNEIIEYVDKEIVTDREYVPVVAEIPTIIKPYNSDNVSINTPFYDPNSTKEEQEKALILYENTYIQNTGVTYTSKEQFDVVAVLEGTVIEVSDNPILGKTIKIRHNDDTISTYQSMDEITVKKDDTILRGGFLGRSGTCKLYSENYNLHFELSHNGQIINPEDSYNKTIDEL